MSLRSMTGYSRAQGGNGTTLWVWEIKSVNGRGLDVRCRLPPGHDNLDLPIREAISKACKRGNVSVTLTVSQQNGAAPLQINEELLEQWMSVIERVWARFPDVAPPRLDGLFALRGIIEPLPDPLLETGEDAAARDNARMATLAEAIRALVAMRAAEGARLEPVLTEQLRQIETLIEQAESCAAKTPEMIRLRLEQMLAPLLEAAPSLPEDRLAQEAALLIGKADVREELDRLRAHVVAGRELLAKKNDTVGRKLDFLCQEFNREANTLCSKSADVELTRIGLDLKAVIEQLREQVQNIE